MVLAELTRWGPVWPSGSGASGARGTASRPGAWQGWLEAWAQLGHGRPTGHPRGGRPSYGAAHGLWQAIPETSGNRQSLQPGAWK